MTIKLHGTFSQITLKCDFYYFLYNILDSDIFVVQWFYNTYGIDDINYKWVKFVFVTDNF